MTRTITLALALAALSCTSTFAGDLAREQVLAELLEVRRTGNLIANNETGLKLNELHPGQYPSRPAPTGRSRAAVQAELLDALRLGEVPGPGESGLKLNELYPAMYPAQAVGPSMTREQVKAELAEARRLGNVFVGDHGQTLAEREPHRYPAAIAKQSGSLGR